MDLYTNWSSFSRNLLLRYYSYYCSHFHCLVHRNKYLNHLKKNRTVWAVWFAKKIDLVLFCLLMVFILRTTLDSAPRSQKGPYKQTACQFFFFFANQFTTSIFFFLAKPKAKTNYPSRCNHTKLLSVGKHFLPFSLLEMPVFFSTGAYFFGAQLTFLFTFFR